MPMMSTMIGKVKVPSVRRSPYSEFFERAIEATTTTPSPNKKSTKFSMYRMVLFTQPSNELKHPMSAALYGTWLQPETFHYNSQK